jgi:transcription elongation factor GreA
MGPVDGNDPADRADRTAWEFELAHLDQRIGRLRDLLVRSEEGPGDDEPVSLPLGVTVVLDFGSGPETFLFSDIDDRDQVDVITPSSPLGRALAGAAIGEPVRYRTPHGEATVRFVAVAASAAA